MIARIGGASEHILKTSPEGSIYNQLYEKNLKSEEQVIFIS